MGKPLFVTILIQPALLLCILLTGPVYSWESGVEQEGYLIQQTYKFGISAGFDAQLESVNLKQKTYTVLAIRLCGENSDAMCRRFLRETYHFDSRKVAQIQELTPDEYLATALNTEEELLSVLEFLRRQNSEEFVNYRTLPVSNNRAPNFRVEIQYNIDSHRTLRNRIYFIAANGETRLVSEGVGILQRTMTLKETDRELWIALDIRSCARACGGTVEIYRIEKNL